MTPAGDPPLRPGAVSDAAGAKDGDALLVHAEFLKRIARVLVGAGAAADDLVQETWLAALNAPPRARSAAAVRGWLARVARNAVAEERRGSGRRRAREELAARPEFQPDETRAVEQLEISQRVVRRVLELEEPYRTTVVLRYLEDRPPREIARRMGVPVDTVHTRLRRALAKLRGALDADSGGDRSAWCVALAPLAGLDAATAAAVLAPAASATATLGTLGLLGAFSMKLTIGILVAGAVGVFYLVGPGLEPRQPAPVLEQPPTDGANVLARAVASERTRGPQSTNPRCRDVPKRRAARRPRRARAPRGPWSPRPGRLRPRPDRRRPTDASTARCACSIATATSSPGRAER